MPSPGGKTTARATYAETRSPAIAQGATRDGQRVHRPIEASSQVGPLVAIPAGEVQRRPVRTIPAGDAVGVAAPGTQVVAAHKEVGSCWIMGLGFMGVFLSVASSQMGEESNHRLTTDARVPGLTIAALRPLYCRSVSNHVSTSRRLGRIQRSWSNRAGAPGSTTLTQHAPRAVKLW